MLKKYFLFVALLFLVASMYAQENLVDQFSGDFHYEVPGIYLPSADGPGVPIGLNYKSGISVHQKGSWVGLGWNLDVGEIRRDVNGVPDDWVGATAGAGVVVDKHVFDKQTNGTWTDSVSTTEYFGPLYFSNFGTRTANKEMDVYASSISGSTFFFPDFDNFSVSAPGVGGVMRPLILDIASMVKKNAPKTHVENAQPPFIWDAPGDEVAMGTTYEDYDIRPTSSPETDAFKAARKAQFRYLNEPGEVAVQDNENNQFKTSTTTALVTDPDPNKNYYKTIGAKHVIFYTKQDIINGTNLDGLIKASGFNYNDANFRSTDIVAFKITNEFGVTYHFSLPVLLKNQKTYSLEFNSTGVLADKYDIAQISRVSATTMPSYVVSWKLVAVTGPDFVDNGTLNAVDAADQGYWVKYTYALWENTPSGPTYKWQSPYLDANRNFGEDVERLELYKQSYPYVKGSPNSAWGEFTDESNITMGETQMYYLEKMETSTHTAFFVKDLRYDEHSKKQTVNELPLPSLMLKRIVVMNNADVAVFGNPVAMGNTTPTAKFTIPTNSTSMIHETKYQANKANIDAKTVSAVEFVYDHSLCKNYTGNIYNNVTTVNTGFNSFGTPYNFTYEKYNTAGAAPANSGKLTLLKVIPYGAGGVNTNLLPAVEFQYSTVNPDFHPHKKDFWGFYLSDWSPTRLAEYQTSNSIPNISAWHLAKIATPLGGIIEVEYESDKYSKVGGYDKKITRVFGGKYLDATATVPATFELDDSGLYDLINSGGAVGSAAVAYPCQCAWAVQYYYPPTASSSKYVYSRNETVRKQVFTQPSGFSTSLNGSGKTLIRPAGTAFDFDLRAFCGDGPNYPAYSSLTVTGDQKFRATATVTLNYAYGGGVRVKRLKMRETDVNGTPREYYHEYIYGINGDGNGVASQEPGRYTPPTYSHRPVLRDLYDRHGLPPAVGYSRVTEKNIGADGLYGDNYTESNFNNYENGPGRVGIWSQNKTIYDPITNWDVYFNCIGLCSEGNNACYTACGNGSYDPFFTIKALMQTGVVTARDQSRTFVGKLASSRVFDKNGRLISAMEQEYEKFNSASSMFYQKTHGFVPITYDPLFLSVPDPVKGRIGAFGPFDSPNVRSVSTLVNSRVFYEKIYQNERVVKTVSSYKDVRTATEFADFDLITGLPKKVKTKDPTTGEEIEKDIEYAYGDPAYSVLGPKGNNITNKNMLTLVSLEKVIKGGNMIDGTRHTFTNTPNVRYWNSGTSSFATGTQTIQWVSAKSFAFNNNTDPLQWREVTENTLYNAKGDPLEVKTYINGTLNTPIHRYGMVKMGYNNRFVITDANDSRYTESTYSGAEDTETGVSNYFSGEVKMSGIGPGGAVNTNLAFVHTGTKSLKLNPIGTGFEYKTPCTGLDKSRTYIARVWVYSDPTNITCKLAYKFVNNSTGVIPPNGSGYVTPTAQSGFNNQGYSFYGKKWVLLTLNIAVSSAGDAAELYTNFNNYSLVVYCENPGNSQTAYFDDFRVHPINSSMTNYVFNTFTGLPEYSINADGFYTRNVYDAMGRIYQQFVETPDGEKQVAEINRNFYRFSNTSPFTN